MPITATTDFDSGGSANLTVDDSQNLVEIEIDDEGSYGANGAWHFRLNGVAGESVSFDITNIDSVQSMPDDYQCLFTYDIDALDWSRFSGDIQGGWSHTFDQDTVYVSNVLAYPYGNIVDQVTQLDSDYPDLVETEVIGQSYEGRDMHVARITDPTVDDTNKQDVISMTRQHPGEVQGSWHMDAAIDYVLANQSHLEDYVFHFIPCANPDGVYGGYHRDVRGYNWNREWNSGGPVEIDQMRTYMQNNLGDVYWGFDFHSSTNSNYESAATRYENANETVREVEIAKDVAEASLSLSSSGNYATDGWFVGWLWEEFSAVGVVTEVYAFYDNTPATFQQEGEGFMAALLEYVNTFDLVAAGDSLVTLNGKLVVRN